MLFRLLLLLANLGVLVIDLAVGWSYRKRSRLWTSFHAGRSTGKDQCWRILRRLFCLFEE
jgi:hypothetical protein